MSGIAGIVMAAGCAVDEHLLRRLAASISGRGPDGERTWNGGRVGFAHTLLQTRNVRVAEQPASIDGEVWIIADARIDGRAELVRALEIAGAAKISSTDDAHLILHAYEAWGERCVDHLIGDFAFAIWDGRARRLFCARDHFGIKPFYYAEIDGAFIFSNTLDCVRLHPGLDGTLNELSIADFLLFGFHQDTAATAFADVHRLPPAYTLTLGTDACSVRRYWTLPTDGQLRYRRSRDYVDHFTALLHDAVADRIDGNGSSIWLSGGVDSAAIAVTARQVARARGVPLDLAAHTVVYDSLIADDERRYAGFAGEAAGIAPRFWSADDSLPFDGWKESRVRTPEPTDDPYCSRSLQQLHAMRATGAVALTGDGGDELLWRSYALDLVDKMPLPHLAFDLARCVLVHRRRPAAGVRAKLESWLGRQPDPTLPDWIDDDLAARLHLHERMNDVASAEPAQVHPLRPDAHRRLSSRAWPAYLESLDPGFTGVAVEHRLPFLDLRLVKYVLSIPPLPWCVDKQLLRLAMRESLPALLLRRKKSPLMDDPLRIQLQAHDWSWIDRFEASPQLTRFVNRAAVPPLTHLAAGPNPWSDLRPFCLNYWLSRDSGRRERGC